MGFGCSFSLVEVDCINWVKTSLSKRILRTILGGAIAIGIYFMFHAIGNQLEDQPLQFYVLNQLLPSFFIPFVIYGPFLVLCQKLKLVDTQYPFARSFSKNQPSIIIDDESDKWIISWKFVFKYVCIYHSSWGRVVVGSSSTLFRISEPLLIWLKPLLQSSRVSGCPTKAFLCLMKVFSSCSMSSSEPLPHLPK